MMPPFPPQSRPPERATAPLKPEGVPASAWPDLTPNGRRLLVGRVITRESIMQIGTIDYQRSQEPLVWNANAGSWQTLAGDLVDLSTPPKPGEKPDNMDTLAGVVALGVTAAVLMAIGG